MARFVLFLISAVFFLSGCAYRTTQVIDPAGNRTITTESYYFPTPPGAVRVYREDGRRRDYRYPDYPRYYRDRDREVCWYTYPYNGDRRRPVLLCH